MNARLDKSGTRVLCARIDCGNELAKVVVPDWKPLASLAVGGRYVFFGRRWRLDGRTWKRGRSRRDPWAGPENRGLRGADFRHGELGMLVTVLPASVRCPCGLTQRLDPEALRVGPSRVPGWLSAEGAPYRLMRSERSAWVKRKRSATIDSKRIGPEPRL